MELPIISRDLLHHRAKETWEAKDKHWKLKCDYMTAKSADEDRVIESAIKVKQMWKTAPTNNIESWQS